MAVRSVTFDRLAQLCDRDDALAQARILADSDQGFSLQVLVDDELHTVVRSNGTSLFFRSIDQLLDALLDIPNLARLSQLEITNWKGSWTWAS